MVLALFYGSQTALSQTADDGLPDLYYFVIDRSGSMEPNGLVEPVKDFFDGQMALIPTNSEVRLVFFDTTTGEHKAWSRIQPGDYAAMKAYFAQHFRPGGFTRLYDTVGDVFNRSLADREKYRVVQIMILSDGNDQGPEDSRGRPTLGSTRYTSWSALGDLMNKMKIARPQSYAYLFTLGYELNRPLPPPITPMPVPRPRVDPIPRIRPPPSAAFDFSPQKVKQREAVVFTLKSLAGVESAEWDFGDGTSSSNKEAVVHRYNLVGNYNVRLRVVGPGGAATNFASNAVQVMEDVPLEARYHVFPIPVRVGELVQFVNDSLGGGTSNHWKFPGGAIKFIPNPTHIFTQAGSFPVSLVVSREDKSSSPFTASITVLPPRPKPDFTIQPSGRSLAFGETLVLSTSGGADGNSHTWTIGGAVIIRGASVRWPATNSGPITIAHEIEGAGGINFKDDKVFVDPPVATFSVTPTNRQVVLGQKVVLQAATVATVADLEHRWRIGTNLFTSSKVEWTANQLGRTEIRHEVAATGGTNYFTEVVVVMPPTGPDPSFEVRPETRQVMIGETVTATCRCSEQGSAVKSHLWKIAGQTSGVNTSILRWDADRLGLVEFTHTAAGPGGTNSNSITILVKALPPPDASFSVRPGILVESGQQVSFIVLNPNPGETHRFTVSGKPLSPSSTNVWVAGAAGTHEVVCEAVGSGGTQLSRQTVVVMNRTLEAGFDVMPPGKEGKVGDRFVFKARKTQTGYSHVFRVGTSNIAGAEASWVADREGRVEVVHTVIGGGATNFGADVIIIQANLKLEISASPTNGVASFNVRFRILTPLKLASVRWDFGDGGSSVEISPTHEFTQLGARQVKLEALESGGRKIERTLVINVLAPEPWWKRWVKIGSWIVAVLGMLQLWYWPRPWRFAPISGRITWKLGDAAEHIHTFEKEQEVDLNALQIPGWTPRREYKLRNHPGAWWQSLKDNPHVFIDGIEHRDLTEQRGSFDLDGATFRYIPD